jgi:ABC-type microcin C transport system permease subunit YejB
MALKVSREGSRTTNPELSSPYGRGLDSEMTDGSVNAVGCTRGVYAQFSGILIDYMKFDLGGRAEVRTNRQGNV